MRPEDGSDWVGVYMVQLLCLHLLNILSRAPT